MRAQRAAYRSLPNQPTQEIVLATSRGGSAATAQPPRMAGLVGTVARAPSVADATVRKEMRQPWQ